MENIEIKMAEARKAYKEAKKAEYKEANVVWVIVGFFFSMLGGLIGLGFGANYAFGKYSPKIKALGWLMLIIAVLVISFVKAISKG